MKIVNFRDVVTNFRIGGITKQKVSFYAKRLSKEASARRLASLLLVGLLVFQFITFITPPQKSSASGSDFPSSDLVPGGNGGNLNTLLQHYDSNAKAPGAGAGIQEILTAVGVTRDDIVNSSGATWTCVNGLQSMGWGGGGAASVLGTTVGECSGRWSGGINATGGGIRINRKVYADIGVAGPQWYEIGILNSCDNLVFIPTSPPAQAEPTFVCSNLNYTSTTATAGGTIGFTGYASGQNVTDADLVSMDYQLTDANDVPISNQNANGVRQSGGVYVDPGLRVFTFNTPGTYKMRLWIHYNDKNNQDAIAAGSAVNECIRTLTVGSQKSIQCAQLDIVAKTGTTPFTPQLRGLARQIGDSGANVFPAKFDYILLHKVTSSSPGDPVINYQGTNYLEGNPSGGTSRISHTNSNPAIYSDPATSPAFAATEFKQSAPGDFLVIFRPTDQNGVVAPENPTNCYVPFTVSPPPSSFACTGLSANPTTGTAPLVDVVLTAGARVDNTAVSAYNFDFGDGSKQTVNSTSLSANSAKHTYNTNGTFTATVSIVTGKGTTDPNVCKTTITVSAPSFKCLTLSATPKTGPTPLNVNFTATSSTVGAKVQSYEFDFGDGNKQSVASNQLSGATSHNYTDPGKYSASVMVKTDKGTSQAVDTCKVEIAPTDIRYTKTVSNLTLLTVDGKPTDANGQVAKAGDTLRYQIAVCNATNAPVKGFVFEDDVTNLLYYSDLDDLGGATKVVKNGQTSLLWPAADVPPLPSGQTCTDSSGNLISANFAQSVRTFTVKIKDPIPVAPAAAADASAFNCQIRDEFHGSVVITPIGVIPAKQLECAVHTLPQTGAGIPIFVIAFFAASSAFLFFRNRLLKRELKLVETLSDEGDTNG